MSTLRRSGAVIGSFAAALAVAAVPAAAAWTPPQELPGSAGRYPLLAAYGAAGATSVGTYGPLALTPSNPQAPLAISSAAAPGAAFGPPVGLPDGLTAPVAVSPGGTLLAVGGPRSPLDYFGREGSRARLRAAAGPVGGPLAPISTRAIVATRTLASAVDDAGDAAIVFSRCLDRGCSKRAVLATFRRRGRGFTAPVVLARRTGYPVAAVALNARGDAILAWIQHRTKASGNDVLTRDRLADGTLTKVRVAGPTAPVPTIAVTLSRTGHATVGWFSEAVGEGSVGGPLTIRGVEMNAGGSLDSHFVLARGTPSGHGGANAVPGARLRAVLADDRWTTFAWTGFEGGHFVVRTERIYRDTADGGALLSPPTIDAQLADLEADGAGDTLVVWTTVPGATTTPAVAAVIRPAGTTATFGAPQVVLSGADASGTAAGAIAPGGRAIVAGGPQQELGRDDPPGVRVTELLPG